MEITYIGHSGFLIEWETCYWLFDYYEGKIPDLDREKKLFVFASHKHEDHYNPEIFKLYHRYPNVEYVLSSDINLKRINFQELGISEEIRGRILSVKPSMEYEMQAGLKESIILKTLKSTDCGVAFLLYFQGKTIYHAGDLNLWVWKKGTKQENNNMTAVFNKILNELKDLPIDIAFAPLDPRQEEYYSLGLESLLSTAKVRYVFPMHFWEKNSIIRQFKGEKAQVVKETVIIDIEREGQRWQL